MSGAVRGDNSVDRRPCLRSAQRVQQKDNPSTKGSKKGTKTTNIPEILARIRERIYKSVLSVFIELF